MNESILKAIEKLYSVLDLDGEGILDDIKNDYLSENVTRSGRTVLWYICGDKSVTMYVDSLEIMSEEEIETELL
ncbi:MAG: hypothetical protein J6S85_10365 [Methanobrevibacter sp.]|nr:hypothetical protein [Methanobrevibacter sp.]